MGSDGVLAHWNGVEWSTYDNTTLGHEGITGLDMLTSSAGWAGSTLGNVLRYDGQQWAFENSDVYTATLYSISVLNPSVGWAGGESGIFAHYDGATWQQVMPGDIITSTIWGLDLVSPTDGWAVTGTLDQSGRIGRLLRYEGTTWHQFSTTGQVLYDVDMLNSNYGWAVGAYGTLLQWDGTVWTAASSPSSNTMLDVHVLSTTDAWAVGEGNSGAILYYEEGTGPTPTLTLTDTPTSSPTATPTPIPTATPCTISFSDVLPGSTFYPYIRCLTCLGIVTGYPNNTFRPEIDVTRGQLAKIVSNSADWNDVIPDNQQSFEDVQAGSTFWLFIERMFLHGAIQGYPCGGPGEPCGPGNLPYYRPGNTASRGQICKIVVLSAGLPINTVGGPHFGDVPTGATFYEYIETLYNTGAIQGYSDGNFRPSNNASRGQTSKIVSLTFFPSCLTP